jgi:hypothetical protein
MLARSFSGRYCGAIFVALFIKRGFGCLVSFCFVFVELKMKDSCQLPAVQTAAVQLMVFV